MIIFNYSKYKSTVRIYQSKKIGCFIYFQVFELVQNGFSGKFCGTIPPPVINSEWNTLIVLFSTDDNIAGSGFIAKYWHEKGTLYLCINRWWVFIMRIDYF